MKVIPVQHTTLEQIASQLGSEIVVRELPTGRFEAFLIGASVCLAKDHGMFSSPAHGFGSSVEQAVSQLALEVQGKEVSRRFSIIDLTYTRVAEAGAK